MPRSNTRRGFTLVELLVAMALIATLATLAALIVPSLRSQKKAGDAADRIQGWLLQAKMRAMRDQAPRGLRLILDPNDATGNTVTELQFIEQPDNYAPRGTAYVNYDTPMTVAKTHSTYVPKPNKIEIRSREPISTFVTEGDLIKFVTVTDPGKNVYRVAGTNVWPWQTGTHPDIVTTGNNTTLYATTEIPLASATDSYFATPDFYFIRQARPLLGEEPLKLQDGIVVDLAPIPPPSGTSKGIRPPLDILFAPSGMIVTGVPYTDNGTFKTVPAVGKIVLHVRDLEGIGEATLLTIYTRTGSIASFPVSGGADPYEFLNDGKGSGL